MSGEPTSGPMGVPRSRVEEVELCACHGGSASEDSSGACPWETPMENLNVSVMIDFADCMIPFSVFFSLSVPLQLMLMSAAPAAPNTT